MSAEALKSPKTTIAHKRRGVFKRVLQEIGVTVDKLEFSRRIVELHSRLLEKSEDSEFEDLDTYHKLYIYHHLAKLQPQNLFSLFDNLLSVKNVYKQILYHGSYWRYRQLLIYLANACPSEADKPVLLQFANTLALIEQTMKREPLNFLDFCTQLRGRILGDPLGAKFQTDMLRTGLASETICHFKNYHHALRENPRIDIIMKTPTVLRVKFFSDKKRALISFGCGLLAVVSLTEASVIKLIVSKCAVLDSVKLIEDKYAMTAGIDPKIRVWNLETEKQVHKFEVHSYSTIFMAHHKEFVYSYGHD